MKLNSMKLLSNCHDSFHLLKRMVSIKQIEFAIDEGLESLMYDILHDNLCKTANFPNWCIQQNCFSNGFIS